MLETETETKLEMNWNQEMVSAMYSYRLSDLVSQSLPKLTFMLPCLVYKPQGY